MDEPQKIGLTVAESTPRFPADPKPPPGAPNIVVVVLDDTGFGHLGAFGSDIDTPHLDALARSGRRLQPLSTSRPCALRPGHAFFTGRNHHAVGMGFLADIPLAFPGYSARLPKTAATLPRLLRDAGYSTLAVGKWHLTPRWQRSAAGPFDTWPLGWGSSAITGSSRATPTTGRPTWSATTTTSSRHDAPKRGTTSVRTWRTRPIRMVRDQQQGAPGKPFFLYFALGAMHSPHHVAPEWVEPYRGMFDKGWDAWREETFARQVERGIVPPGTILTERPEWVRAGTTTRADERRMHARQQEVFAGFLTHTDAQIGRLLSSLEAAGLLENTSSWSSPTTARARRGARRAASTNTASPPTCVSPWPTTWRLRRLGRLQHLQPLLVGLGLGGEHAAQALEALHLAGRDPDAAARAVARPRRRARRRSARNSPM